MEPQGLLRSWFRGEDGKEKIGRKRGWWEKQSRNDNLTPLQLPYAPTPPRQLLKHRFSGPHPRGSDSVGLAWGPRILISNKFPGDADTAGQGTTLGGPLTSSPTTLDTGHPVQIRRFALHNEQADRLLPKHPSQGPSPSARSYSSKMSNKSPKKLMSNLDPTLHCLSEKRHPCLVTSPWLFAGLGGQNKAPCHRAAKGPRGQYWTRKPKHITLS